MYNYRARGTLAHTATRTHLPTATCHSPSPHNARTHAPITLYAHTAFTERLRSRYFRAHSADSTNTFLSYISPYASCARRCSVCFVFIAYVHMPIALECSCRLLAGDMSSFVSYDSVLSFVLVTLLLSHTPHRDIPQCSCSSQLNAAHRVGNLI